MELVPPQLWLRISFYQTAFFHQNGSSRFFLLLRLQLPAGFPGRVQRQGLPPVVDVQLEADTLSLKAPTSLQHQGSACILYICALFSQNELLVETEEFLHTNLCI